MVGNMSLTPLPKPYHLMTPAERLAARIAQNRKIDEKVEQEQRGLQARKRRILQGKINKAADELLASVIKSDPEGAPYLAQLLKKVR